MFVVVIVLSGRISIVVVLSNRVRDICCCIVKFMVNVVKNNYSHKPPKHKKLLMTSCLPFSPNFYSFLPFLIWIDCVNQFM